jgi:hypothetical protein
MIGSRILSGLRKKLEAGRGKEMDSLLQLPERKQSSPYLLLGILTSRTIQEYVNFYCFTLLHFILLP